jgi:flagellar motor switch protein FliM
VNEQLTQDEIDTLLNGVDSGEISTEPDRLAEDGDVMPYDLASQDHIIRGRMPTLEMVNDRFIRAFRESVFNMLRKRADISIVGVKMKKYADYTRGLFTPTNLNLIQIKPLRGIGLLMIEPKLVFAIVDNYFGGDGRYHTLIGGRDFTPTENRIIQMLLQLSFIDLKKAWEPVLNLEFRYLSSEINPQFANIVSTSEVVVVSVFKMEMDSGGGEFHIIMPYSMLEPIHELLDAGTQNDLKNIDKRWSRMLQDVMKHAEVEIKSSMMYTELSLGDVLNLKPGDVIPVVLPDMVTVRTASTALFKGRLGVSNGKNAVQYVESLTNLDYSHE